MQIYLVGGAIRDRLLGFSPPYENDWVVVNGTPKDLDNRGYKKVGKSFPVYINPHTGDEYALARKENKTGTGYHGFDFDANPSITLEEDLARRDLTINAIAEDENGLLIDPYKGQEDLDNRKLRHVSLAFKEDPLRVLRIARFKAKLHNLGFTITEETYSLITEIVESGELLSLVPERIWLETEKTLKHSRFDQYFKTLIQINALDQIYPDLAGLQKDFFSHIIFQQASQEMVSTKYRFAVIFYALLKEKNSDIKEIIESMQKSMNFPNSYKEIPLLLNNSFSLINKDISKFTPEHILTIIEKLNALKKPENLQAIFKLIDMDLDRNFNDKKELIEKSLTSALTIQISNIEEEGLQGSDIGLKLRELRLNKIQELL
ncbi:multifunctional CCA tRNA nucleotidyl transferase/2'3'-cyclic phosphodiesterase/2'nucleotidase/phosphatase [Gammaproteobacteria bacterium]|jgi:tRNA nucleotidyltransferase (CCA-adding enzyme)|nr:multifunctional CCA tRNA nucleotidyl transferase/2'3'-cyclic phosphodiesterase/2'nucleotidase/phosphatase [Gammaproteobacteria bacterium]